MKITRTQKEILKKLHNLGFKSAKIVPNHYTDWNKPKEKKLILR